MADTEETLLTFPCDFPIKVMGADDPALRGFIHTVIEKYAPLTTADAYKEKLSSGGKFVSVTILIKAESKAQLDLIYSDFSRSPLTSYVL